MLALFVHFSSPSVLSLSFHPVCACDDDHKREDGDDGLSLTEDSEQALDVMYKVEEECVAGKFRSPCWRLIFFSLNLTILDPCLALFICI